MNTFRTLHAMVGCNESEADGTEDAGSGLPSYTMSMINRVQHSTGSDVDREDYVQFYNAAQFITGLVIYPVICGLGLIGNSFILVVLCRKSATSTDVYLCVLAVSDAVKLVNDLLYFVTCLLLEINPPAGNRLFAHLYPYAHFVFNTSVCVSSWLTVALAVERYLLVCRPAEARGLVSVSRSYVVSATIVVLMVVLALPSALRYRTVENSVPRRSGTSN